MQPGDEMIWLLNIQLQTMLEKKQSEQQISVCISYTCLLCGATTVHFTARGAIGLHGPIQVKASV